MKHRSVSVFLNSLTSRDVSVLQPDSAQYCHRTFIKVPFRITCEHVSLETVCSRAMCAPVLLCKKLVVLARPLRDRCRRRSVPDVPPSMRCLCQTLVLRTSEPVCMHCTPTSCPNAADAGRLERDHAPQSTEPSFPGALTATGAARAARGSGQILLQAAGEQTARLPARPPADHLALCLYLRTLGEQKTPLRHHCCRAPLLLLLRNVGGAVTEARGSEGVGLSPPCQCAVKA